MTQSQKFDRASWFRTLSASVVAGLMVLSLAAPSEAQRGRNNDEEATPEGRVLSTAVGEQLLAMQECQAVEDNSCVLRILNELSQNTDLSPYERFVVLQQRGRAYFEEDRYDLSIRDFDAALNTGAAITDEIIALRSAMAQLYQVQENFPAAINQYELAIAAGAELTPAFSKTVAQAYLQADRIAEGVRYAEIFYNGTPNKTEGDFNLMHYFYQQLERRSDELRVVRDFINAYPSSRRAWQNLVALYSMQDDVERAFETNKLMYLNGIFEEENELIRLVSYYSFFENPYRGATILEREINAGRVEGNEENLDRLANMWRQAGEFDRATPVLERLSNLIGDGETALRLAEAHFQRNNFAEAEAAFQVALDRGGLSDTGKAWELLGTSRFRQGERQSAIAAFREAARFPRSRSSANGWINWISSQIEGERRRRDQREQIVIEGCGLSIEAERRSLVLIGVSNDGGRVQFPEGSIPQECLVYYDPQYGELFREVGMSDEEAEQALADLLARIAQEDANAAGAAG